MLLAELCTDIRERNTCFFSLFRGRGRGEAEKTMNLPDQLSGSGAGPACNCSHLPPGTRCVDGSNFILLHLLKDQPGLKLSFGHSQEAGVSYPHPPPAPKAGSCSQPRRPVCCTQGGTDHSLQ